MVPSRALAAVVAACVVASASAAQEVFRSGVEMVHLPVVVLDRSGAPVRGLVADDFLVRDGGEAQVIRSFAEGPPGADVPLHVGLMLDKSESMEPDRRDAASAVIDFVEAVEEAKDVTFVEFESTIRLSRFEPPSYPQLFLRIRDKGRGRFTALYDAMGHYVADVLERPGQHLLVLHTDGGDTSSRSTAGHVRDALRAGNVMLYVIGYLEHAAPSDRIRLRSVMTDLARETGGEAFYPTNLKDVARFYGQIEAEMAGRYTIGYDRPRAEGSGRFRSVSVTLRRPMPGAQLRARRGYVGTR